MKYAAAALILACVPTVLSAQSSSEPMVHVGLFTYRLDGSFAGYAVDSGPELDGTVSASRCIVGAGPGDRQLADATDSWRFAGRVVRRDAEQAVVQLNWRRTLANGKQTAGNESSVELTLRLGEPVQLDLAGPSCPSMSVTFEARYAQRPYEAIRTTGGSGAMLGAVSVGRGSVARGGDFPGGTSVARVFNVDLWIIHAIPGQPDQVIHSLLRINENGGQFTLAPLRVSTALGVSSVQISGSFYVIVANGSEERLVFRTTRRVTPPTAGTAGPDPSRDILGSSLVVNKLPGPDDVLSFEMPPIQVGNETLPDRFSIRMKVVPR